MKITVIFEDDLIDSNTRIQASSDTGTFYPMVPNPIDVNRATRNAMNTCLNRAMDLGLVK